MPEPSRRLRLFLRCLAALLLGILLLAGAAMVYVQHKSVAITHALLEDFTQRTGLHLHVRSIGLSWLPPAVQADDVRIRIKELDISVRTARLRPRLTAEEQAAKDALNRLLAEGDAQGMKGGTKR